MIAFASSLDQAGPITKTVADAALLFRHMAGADDRDMTSVGLQEELEIPTRSRLDGVTIGVPEELTGEGVEPGVRAAFEASLEVARQLGATVKIVQLPHAPAALSAYYVLAPAEGAA